ncbi:expressed unknown protein [Seminavis robusta]|uniref:J domain-containing protein n=1 Tax=Seminavis robusta TaxID=568900 RepID=A0A9N8HQ33_9STRA|nr:expressed unknown protein [Seminavis robusta]|eukprot:Sro1395_g269020.1 n/a (391) ;mRNA; r:3033-4205
MMYRNSLLLVLILGYSCLVNCKVNAIVKGKLEKCYHKVLGVKTSVRNTKTIKRAYRKRAKTVHPDKSSKSSSMEKFLLLNEALEFMLIPENREQLREFLKKKQNQKHCGWRFDYPTLGRAFDSSWRLFQTAGKTGLDAVVMVIDSAGNVYQQVAPRITTANLVYLDNSGSMSFGFFSSWLDIAHPLLKRMAPSLQGAPTSVILFGSDQEVVVREAKTFNVEAILRQWKGQIGGTYMWHMIQQDLLENRKVVSSRRLRVFIVTDGEDNKSPGDYMGVGGMNPMMSHLINAGYDIEFHITVLGVGNIDSRGYRDLTRATGGNFLYIDWRSKKSLRSEIEVEGFIEQIAAYTSKEDITETEAMRSKKKREYELDVQKGEATEFEWYKQLPGHA